MSDPLIALRGQLARMLDWKEAHAGFDAAVASVPEAAQGKVPPGFDHSPWQLLEHMRIAQADILDFCVNASYEEKKWPDDYWPASPQPPSASSWAESVAAFRTDRDRLAQLTGDPGIDLFARIPHGTGQTYLREVLLVFDHNAYHVGQLVAARRALGVWP